MTLQNFFLEHKKVAIAFSGGVDSAYLLYAAKKYGADTQVYYVNSAFQPQFELEDAKKLAEQLEVPMTIIPVDVLCSAEVTANPSNRCYFCKRRIFDAILQRASQDGYMEICDGTNASDDEGDRPGMQVLKEMKVLSPLKICGLTKAEVRELSKEAGLFTWDKPAYACLATRIKTGEEITKEKLEITEAAEDFLFSLGFKDFRVRMVGSEAKLQVKEEQMELLLSKREEILQELGKHYTSVVLDLKSR